MVTTLRSYTKDKKKTEAENEQLKQDIEMILSGQNPNYKIQLLMKTKEENNKLKEKINQLNDEVFKQNEKITRLARKTVNGEESKNDREYDALRA